MSVKLHRFNAWTQSYHSSQCRKSTACLSDSRNLLSTRAVRLSVHLMCRNSRCFPWRQKETHMAGHWSCHHRPGSWSLYRHITTRRWCTLDNLVMWLQITPVAFPPHQQVHRCPLPFFTHPTLDSWLHCQGRCRSSAYYLDSWTNAVHRCRWLQSLCGMFPPLTLTVQAGFQYGLG